MYAISQSPDSERYAWCIRASRSVREDIEKALAPRPLATISGSARR